MKPINLGKLTEEHLKDRVRGLDAHARTRIRVVTALLNARGTCDYHVADHVVRSVLRCAGEE